MSFNELKIHGTHDFPFELYRIDAMHPKYEMAFHWHTNIEIIRIISGKLQINLNHREFLAKQGDIIFINSETVHGAHPLDCKYECLVFNPNFMPSVTENGKDFSEDLVNRAIFVQEYYPAKNDDFHDTVRLMFNTIATGKKGMRYQVVGFMCRLYGIIIEKNYLSVITATENKGSKNMLRLKGILKYIRDSYDAPISLDEIAHHCNMSPKYLCAFFKEMTHTSPVDYLITYRIERASRQLIATEKSVTDIAFSCGFNDLSYFIKTFKTLKGVTPGNFRK